MPTPIPDSSETDATAPAKPARLFNPIHCVVRAFFILALALVILPLALFAVSLEAGFWGELFGIFLGLSMLLAGLLSALVGWPVSRRLKRFQQGEYLVHWTYRRNEWLAFAESEWQHRRRESRQGPRLGLLIGGLSGLIWGGVAAYGLFSGAVAVVAGILAGAALLGLLGAVVGWLGGGVMRLAGWRTYQWMRQRAGETYIGVDAAYVDGGYWSWTTRGCELVGLELVVGSPTVLDFALRISVQRGRYVYHYRAPVPQGHEGEARSIVERLSRR